MNRIALTEAFVNELREAGNQMDLKVTAREVNGTWVVYIRDYEFTDFIKAARYIQQIAAVEIADSGLYLA